MWFCSCKYVWWWWQSLQSSTEIMESENHGMLWVGKDLKKLIQCHPCHSRDTLHCPKIIPSQGRWHNQDGNVPPGSEGLGEVVNPKSSTEFLTGKISHTGIGDFLPFSTQSHCSWSGHMAGDKGTSVAPEQPEVELLGKERQGLGTQDEHWFNKIISNPANHRGHTETC